MTTSPPDGPGREGPQSRPAEEAPGAPVYRGMDRATVDRQYNARDSVASFEHEMALYQRDSDQVRENLAGFETVVYDEASGERLDLYPAGQGSPVFLWIHGGYWRGGSRLDNAYAAGGLVRHGISVAVIDYTLAPAVDITEIVRQVRKAVAWLVAHGGERGLKVDRLHIGGSSAGGHLVGMVLADDGWTRAQGLADDVIDVALALSGLFDLEPLPLTQVNEWMRFTPEAVAANSPARFIPKGPSRVRLLTAAGGLETDEFRRQTRDYTRAWQAAGHQAREIDMPDHNHFNLARSLVEPDGVLVKAVAAAIKAGEGGR